MSIYSICCSSIMSIDVNAATLVKGSTYVTNRAINIPRTKRDTDLHGSVDRLVA